MALYDYHSHSTYSDGTFIESMIATAEDLGLDGLGITDHCNVSDRPAHEAEKYRHGFSLDRTYDRRRRAIEDLREDTDLRVIDGVEMDYAPEEEANVAAFLEEADFEYAIGSVHHVGDRNVNKWGQFDDDSEAELDAVIETYVDNLVSLAESELFDVAAHLDVVERNPNLRGRLTQDHYDRVAAAFADSRTFPEVNAGSVTRDYGEFHPAPTFYETMREQGIEFTVGSDAHSTTQLRERVEALRTFLDEQAFEPVRIVE